ncbi:MAG: 30S ribosomal protein S7 [Caldiserica bacterium]|nr:MAG: 30S ribosomal protein S7 [Caldisericota bacterium]
MPRKGPVKRREIPPDVRYNSVVAHKFINKLMWDGKKTVAEKIFYTALENAAKKLNKKPLEVLERAIENVKPKLEVRPRRVGGATYQVPMEVRPERALHLAIKWIIDVARSKKGRPMHEKLCDELILAFKGEGGAVKKREDMHKMAEANRAFAHYRW